MRKKNIKTSTYLTFSFFRRYFQGAQNSNIVDSEGLDSAKMLSCFNKQQKLCDETFRVFLLYNTAEDMTLCINNMHFYPTFADSPNP